MSEKKPTLFFRNSYYHYCIDQIETQKQNTLSLQDILYLPVPREDAGLNPAH